MSKNHTQAPSTAKVLPGLPYIDPDQTGSHAQALFEACFDHTPLLDSAVRAS